MEYKIVDGEGRRELYMQERREHVLKIGKLVGLPSDVFADVGIAVRFCVEQVERGHYDCTGGFISGDTTIFRSKLEGGKAVVTAVLGRRKFQWAIDYNGSMKKKCGGKYD